MGRKYEQLEPNKVHVCQTMPCNDGNNVLNRFYCWLKTGVQLFKTTHHNKVQANVELLHLYQHENCMWVVRA